MSELLVARRPSFAFCKRHGVLLLTQTEDKAQVICREGVSPTALSEIRRFAGLPIALETVATTEFDRLLQQAYEGSSGSTMESVAGIDSEIDLDQLAQDLPEPDDLLEADDDAPIIRLINAMLTEAIQQNASDIHVESFENRLEIRFRVDGILREVLQPRRSLAPLLVSRIKVMAKLDIAEKRLPQDGRISLKIAGRAVDVRVSTLPSAHGERVVLRLLDKQAGRLDLKHLGMETTAMNLLDEIIHKPHGIMLVTGPTGSGKTTTLYAGLSRLNNKRRNIMTVEDPVEYFLDGVAQTQVNSKVDMSFARGLRAILRQDPDVVMVGEIRDLETAEIAVQASLTGHMVFSTLHTNSAVGAINRLRDMGVEPFLLASSLVGLLAQRLVRRLCKSCKKPYTADDGESKLLKITASQPNPTIYQPHGCEACGQSGYKGRTGIYELVAMDNTLRTMIHDASGEHEMEAYARSKTASLSDDGYRLVLEGQTSLEEVLRVTRER